MGGLEWGCLGGVGEKGGFGECLRPYLQVQWRGGWLKCLATWMALMQGVEEDTGMGRGALGGLQGPSPSGRVLLTSSGHPPASVCLRHIHS